MIARCFVQNVGSKRSCRLEATSRVRRTMCSSEMLLLLPKTLSISCRVVSHSTGLDHGNVTDSRGAWHCWIKCGKTFLIKKSFYEKRLAGNKKLWDSKPNIRSFYRYHLYFKLNSLISSCANLQNLLDQDQTSRRLYFLVHRKSSFSHCPCSAPHT